MKLNVLTVCVAILVWLLPTSSKAGADKPIVYFCNDLNDCSNRNLDADLQGLMKTLVNAVIQRNDYLIWKLDPETRELPFDKKIDGQKSSHLYSTRKLEYGWSVREILIRKKVISIVVQEWRSQAGRPVAIVFFYPRANIKLNLPLSITDCRKWHQEFVTTKVELTREGWRLKTLFDNETELC